MLLVSNMLVGGCRDMCLGCKVARVVSEVMLTAGDWEVDCKQVSRSGR